MIWVIKEKPYMTSENSPGEMVDLINDPSYKTQLNECRTQLMEWAKANNDPFIKFLIK